MKGLDMDLPFPSREGKRKNFDNAASFSVISSEEEMEEIHAKK